MSRSDRSLRLARWWALTRLALGTAAVLRPAAMGRALAAPDPGEPVQQLVVRNAGGRDLALSLALLLSLRRRGRPRVWIATAALVDAVDLGAVLADWSALPKRQRRLIAASAGGSALTGAVLAAAVRTRAKPPS